MAFNPLSAKFIKWSNTLKQIVGKLPTICLSVFDHFSGLAFKGLNYLNLHQQLADSIILQNIGNQRRIKFWNASTKKRTLANSLRSKSVTLTKAR